MGTDNEPSPKRRRLSPGAFENTPASCLNYIPIAVAAIAVQPVSEELKNLLSTSSEPIAVEFKAVVESANGFDVSCSVRGLKLMQSLATSGPILSPSKDILRDSAKLDSAEKNSSRSFLPLAITRATLRVHNAVIDLQIQLLWQDTPEIRDKVDHTSFDILNKYIPSGGIKPTLVPETWDPRQFYDNVHVPEKTVDNDAELRIDLLQSRLYPFQRRGVRWLLGKEGVTIQDSGEIIPLFSTKSVQLPLGFCASQDDTGRIYYVNHTLGVVCSQLPKIIEKFGPINGGILADEMGLGKTLEVIALICLHRRPDPKILGSEMKLKTSGSTLIITPPTILEQWKQEIQEHAPSLKVYHYEGIRPSRLDSRKIVGKLLEHDIILTTYKVIAKEIHYVAEKPDRDLRHRPRAEPPKSPLTEIRWWRVCLDEAQMVESGVSAAATVARLIPRDNAWAVTGTPLRKGHRDLFGLMLFLRSEPWCHSARVWDKLISYYRPLFREHIGQVAIRHSKDFVREDLRLPPQSRHTITIPFTAVEEQHYRQLLNELCDDCDLDEVGGPKTEDWDPESPATVEKLRSWLTRLRQTCLHPEVGIRNRKALGRSAGPLRTVQQVLDVMIDQNEASVRVEQRSLLLSQTRRGQMQENAKETPTAMEIWRTAYQQSSDIVDECRRQLQDEFRLQKGPTQSPLDQDNNEDDGNDETDTQIQTLRQRLRSALEIKHICIFFIANAYFQLKSDEASVKPESEEFAGLEKLEVSAYEEAKSIRGELLFEVLRKANRLISNVKSKADRNELAHIPNMQHPPEYTGIESRKVFDKLFFYCAAMNKQRTYFQDLRQKMAEFLRQGLIDEDEGIELQGDEYESSTKHQDEMYAYMEALRATFADRSDAISGQENLLIRQEMKQFLRSAKEGEGPAPELMLKLLAEREENRVKVSELGSLRGIVTEIRQLITSLQWQESGGSSRARSELVIANQILSYVLEMATAQTKSLPTLEQEVNLFRDTMNGRLDYYRALQKISDTVAPYDEEHIGEPINMGIYRSHIAQEEKLQAKVSTLLSKRRYLLHLKLESSSEAPRICTICQCEFEVGTLTVCGHQFCKECIQLWYTEHRNCPVCKKRLYATDFHDITYKPAELAVQAESPASNSSSPGSGTERSLAQSIYSDISTATLNEIKNVDIQGHSFGSKVDFICRHLFWLRDHDPGSKIIIFSQFREFLDVLGRAFKQYQIFYSRFDDKNGIERFKSDPAIECFLLHAKAHSAGLNLVVANHVFLCEPLINTAIELQAIARVHRIGQHRATTVWMYLIADTVEESIYEISVSRRMAHMRSTITSNNKGKSRLCSTSGTDTPHNMTMQENAIDAANSMELQAADLSKLLISGKSGGEMVEKEDLWPCLFGKAKKRETVISRAPESLSAAGEVGKFLRAEAAERRFYDA